jgi:hypothetical protein
MQTVIENIICTRKYLLDICEPLSIEQLNTIPNGFNNNIIWNIGHLIAAQQGICYIRAGLATIVNESILEQFKSGSKPNKQWNLAEFAIIKQTLIDSLDQLKKDVEQGIFHKYESFQTRYGVSINNFTEAIQFLPFHEGLHTGTIVAIKKLVTQP